MRIEVFDDNGNTVSTDSGTPLAEVFEQARSEGMLQDQAKRIDFGGRANIRNNQWYGPNNSWGAGYPPYSQSFGTGETPNINWYSRGFLVEAGQAVDRLRVSGRCNATNVTAIEFALWFLTGPMDNQFDNNSEAVRTQIATLRFDQLDNGTTVADRQLREVNGVDFAIPSDGFLVPVFRGIEATSNRVFYFEGIIGLK